MPLSATSWGATTGEADREYRCDRILPAAPGRWLRAIDVAAAPSTVFRRVAQLRAAPYSYDWLDNFGRRSPRELLPWCWDLAEGQSVMTIFTLESFEPDRELTVLMKPGRATTIFGSLALTYRVEPVGAVGPDEAGASRLLAVMRVCDAPGPLGGARRSLLAWGDLLMMRKQLVTLAGLAAADAG